MVILNADSLITRKYIFPSMVGQQQNMLEVIHVCGFEVLS